MAEPDNRTHNYVPAAPSTASFGDSDAPGAAAAAGSPQPAAGDPPPAAPARYILGSEIARGGMGIVYRATDTAFGREVAIKVLQDRFGPESGAAERFATEARITAHLQHPGIPPVHDLGTLPDGRPFLAMKYVKGVTLAAMLEGRPNPAHNRGLFVSAFERVCQTVAFAHAHGVIHRDLKPSNVMVGAFGEVQVMDWGLAKVIGTPDRQTPPGPGARARTGVPLSPDPDGTFTRIGSVLGTPAYLPPEQARGAVDMIDRRSDVFGLGAILAVILTGYPPFHGGGDETVRMRAARGEVRACFARLDACGADPKLVALCKRCLAPFQADRPADADVVARAAVELRQATDDRARRAEFDRVKAEGERATAEARAEEEAKTRRVAEEKADEQRKRRRTQQTLALAVALLVSGAGAFAWWRNDQANERQLADERAGAERRRLDADRKLADERAEAEANFKAEQARHGIDSALALAARLRNQYRFADAERALKQAAELAAGGAPERRQQVERATIDLAFVVRLDAVRYRRWIADRRRVDLKASAERYRAAFADYGLDPTALAPADAAARIAASDVRAELVAAVDDWAAYEFGSPLQPRLLEVARLADPGPWTDRFRTPAVRVNPAALRALAADAERDRPAAAAIGTLAVLMAGRGLDPVPLLTAAHLAHPNDFELAFSLGNWLHAANPTGERHFGPYGAALALRPESAAVWCNLGNALLDRGDVDSAVTAYKRAIAVEPKLAEAHNNLGNALSARGDRAGAIAAYKTALELDPTVASVHVNLGTDLLAKGDRDGAVAAYKKALDLAPQYALAHTCLGVVLLEKGDVFGAVAAHKKALELEPKLAAAHANLGSALHALGDLNGALAATRKAIELDPRLARAHFNLGVTLYVKGDRDGAAAAYQKAIELDPKLSQAHADLGVILGEKGDAVGALAALKTAIELDPKDPLPHSTMGNILRAKGDLAGAVASFKRAIELDPKFMAAHYNLGGALTARGDRDGAIAAFKKAIELAPNFAAAHTDLGFVYFQHRNYPEAIACARAAIKVDPKYSNAHAMLGDLLMRTGDLSGARAALTEAVRLDRRWAPLLAKLPPVPVAPPPREVPEP
jgi:tetratricopeptide (TPR) repeat protein